MRKPWQGLAHRDRADFGLPEGFLVGFCQNLNKWAPEHDELVAEVSQAVPLGLFAFEFGSPVSVRVTRERWERAGARVTWLPMADPGVFQRILGLMDLTLDAPDFHGGYTTFCAMAERTPVLSWAGDEFRSRMALGFQARFGGEDAVVHDRDAFVRRATDPDWAHGQRNRLEPEGMFDDLAPVRALERHILR
jgi:predicted O-linked N-acetylglucosamine transferase (SPINDLY family)